MLFVFSTVIACNAGGSISKIKDIRNVGSFNSIDISGAIDVKVYVGSESSVEVIAPDNMLSNIVTEVEGNTLKVYFKGKGNFTGTAQVIVRTPQLVSAEVSGASKLYVANLNNSSFALDVSGASKVEVEGSTSSLTVEGSGASHLDLSKFNTSNATVDMSGASHGILNVQNQLTIDASGASRVEYYGTPEIKSDVSGASQIKSIN
jgi:surface protein